MIGSFSNNFIFIKTRKTGSTSVEIVLSSWCNENDICSPISPEDELVRLEYGGMPRNFSRDKKFERQYIDALVKRAMEELEALRATAGRKKIEFKSHMPAAQVARKLPKLWADSFKFTIDRHPYEKIVSAAYWKYSRLPPASRKDIAYYVDKLIDSGRTANYPLYMDGCALLVDKVFRYDEMWERLGELGARLGKSLPAQLPRAKGKFREDRRPAGEILSRRQKAKIRENCGSEFELLGWKP